MPIGPRLDRPSAVGDEGRPRATSLTITAVLVVGVLVAAGFLNGRPLVFTSVGLLVALTTAGLALLSRDRLGATVMGHLCFLPSAVAVVAIVGFTGIFALFAPGVALLSLGGLAAMFGIAAAWTDALDSGAIKRVLTHNGLAYLFWVIGVISLLVAAAGLWLLRTLLGYLVGGAGPVGGLFGIVAMVGVAGGCLFLAVWSIPAVQLAPSDRRDRTRERYGRLKRGLLVVALAPWPVLVLLVVLAVLGPLGAFVGPIAPFVELLAPLGTAVLTVVAAVSLLITVGVRGVRWAISGLGNDDLSVNVVGAVLAALGYIVAYAIAVVMLTFLSPVGLVSVLVIPFLPLFVYAAALCLFVAYIVGLVPGRAGPAALSAAGLVAMGIGGAVAGYPSLFVFGAVAAGLIVWDVGTFGLGVTAELGHLPETRRMELYHGVFAVGVGFLGVAALTLLDATRQSLLGGLGTPVAMAIAVVGVVLLLVPLRG
jgi:hypothetical protein